MNHSLRISKGMLNMGDKNPKNIKKIKERAEVKHEEVKEWKHETPTEKQETHKQEEAKKNPEPEQA